MFSMFISFKKCCDDDDDDDDCYCMHEVPLSTLLSQCMCGGHRTALWSWFFFLSTFLWV